MQKKITIHCWLQQKNLILQTSFTDELQQLAAAYKKTNKFSY